jgi:hypothetical protein
MKIMETNDEPPDPDFFESDEDDDFQPCDECDCPDGCFDFNQCGIKKGLWKKKTFDW